MGTRLWGCGRGIGVGWLIACAGCSSTPATSDGGAHGSTSVTTGHCTGNPALCLSGSVTATAFSAPSKTVQVQLFSVFPGLNQVPDATQILSLGGTWAFGGLSPAVAYYLQVVVVFDTLNEVSEVVGPFSVPGDGGAFTVDVPPVSLNLLEAQTAGGAPMLELASATLFDPATGAQVVDGGSVTLALGDASVALPWNAATSAFSYLAPAQTPAPSTYAVTVTPPGASAQPNVWLLAADPPTGETAIASLAPAGDAGPTVAGDASADATLPAKTPLVATFSGPADSDYVQVELFEQEGGAWTQRYESPAPEAPATTQEVIGATSLDSPGMYLIDVLYTKANCPLGGAGCVQAAAVAAQQFDVVSPDGG